MVNFDGVLKGEDAGLFHHTNRGLRYGDALSETVRVLGNKIVFWEDHYFRLMSAMRLMRMEIPMDFTMEYLEEQIRITLEANNMQNIAATVRLTVFREGKGSYLPVTHRVSWYMEAIALKMPYYVLEEDVYNIELFRDYFISADLLATLNTNNKALRVVAAVYASENGFNSCLLLNHNKMVVEATDGNVFLLKGKNLKTPPLSDGCTNGIIRKKILEIAGGLEGFSIEESSVSPFDLQKADELFLTGTAFGIRPVTHYRKAAYATNVARELLGKLNAMARLS